MNAPHRHAITTATTLTVSSNRRYLEADGDPFFYLADTAWTLFKRLDHDEAEVYLRNRAEKGFTVIQAYLLRGLDVTNLDGHLPLIDHDPMQLNEGFFANVDHIVERANDLGLVMGIVATMGEHVRRNPSAERFKDREEQVFTVDNAFDWGRMLGQRYRDRCVIWILGGDRNPRDEDVAVWDAMARGFKDGSDQRHLVTYHSSGGHSSSEYFNEFAWLDFNTVQSKHGSGDPNYTYIEGDYALPLVKPTLDMESRYEDHPDGNAVTLSKVFEGEERDAPRIDAFQTREAAYWPVFAGAAGHGYGHNSIWQMHDADRVDSLADYSFPYIPPTVEWREAIDSDGAFGISYLRTLVELRPWYLTEPDPSIIVEGGGAGEDHVSALRARDGSFALVHNTLSTPVTVDLGRLDAARVRASWFDPTDSTFHDGGVWDGGAQRRFVPPQRFTGRDSVLVLDDDALDLPTSP